MCFPLVILELALLLSIWDAYVCWTPWHSWAYHVPVVSETQQRVERLPLKNLNCLCQKNLHLALERDSLGLCLFIFWLPREPSFACGQNASLFSMFTSYLTICITALVTFIRLHFSFHMVKFEASMQKWLDELDPFNCFLRFFLCLCVCLGNDETWPDVYPWLENLEYVWFCFFKMMCTVAKIWTCLLHNLHLKDWLLQIYIWKILFWDSQISNMKIKDDRLLIKK